MLLDLIWKWSDFSKYFLLIKLTHYFSFWFSLITRLGLTLFEILIEYAYALCFYSIPFHSIPLNSTPFHSKLYATTQMLFSTDEGSIYSMKKKKIFFFLLRNQKKR